MACFTACLAEGLVVYGVKRYLDHKPGAGPALKKWSGRLGTLISLLAGGSAVLAVEHVVHGEIAFTFPFLTALRDPAAAAVMAHEILTVGLAMDLTVTAAFFLFMLLKDLSARAQEAR